MFQKLQSQKINSTEGTNHVSNQNSKAMPPPAINFLLIFVVNFTFGEKSQILADINNSPEVELERYGHGFDNASVELAHEKRERMTDFPDYRDEFTRAF